MSDEEARQELARECPRKIMGLLHVRGHYIHCTSDRFPGKVLCFHKDSELPADSAPTPAQLHFGETGAQSAQRKPTARMPVPLRGTAATNSIATSTAKAPK